MPISARSLPLLKCNIVRHGIFITAILPLTMAISSLVHAANNQFIIPIKPSESFQSYDNVNRKWYTTQDFSKNQVERPYFEYNM